MTGTPPPGWYPEGPHMRWWDGAQWGPYSPMAPMRPQSLESSGRTMAVVSHLGFIGTFVLPLVIYLIERNKPDRNEFVCHHACEALNFQITFGIVWIGGFMLFFAGLAGGGIMGGGEGVAWIGGGLFLIFWLVMVVAMVLSYVFGILGAVRAGNDVWWRYPIALRFVGRGRDWRAEAAARGALLAS